MARLLPIAEAQRLVLDRAQPLESETVAVEEARGRVLAEPAVARADLPPFRSSAMDGFAVRSDDAGAAPVTLPVVARVAAGRPAPRPLAAGEAMAISTGGVVPDGADAVVPLEVVEETGAAVRIVVPVRAGANVRERGGDVRAGETFLAPGVRLGPGQMGALAAAGLAAVRCARRPHVAVLATGSELRPPGEPLGDGEIYESNGALLAAAVASAGAVPERLGIVPDERATTRKGLEAALARADVVVTSGGASVGPHDLVRALQAELGVEEVFWGVSIKPGKPLAFGTRDARLVFSVPGNPVSALVTFELFIRPALAALVGVADPLPRYARGVLLRSLRRDPRRDEFVRATTEARGAEVFLDPLPGRESHLIVRAARADALIAVPAGDDELREGETVRFLPLA